MLDEAAFLECGLSKAAARVAIARIQKSSILGAATVAPPAPPPVPPPVADDDECAKQESPTGRHVGKSGALLQIGAVDNPLAIEQQIEVEGARSPADMALAPVLVFDFVQGRQ